MSWFKQHQKDRAAQDRKEDFARKHAVETRELRKADWEQNSSKLIAKNELERRMKKATQEEEKKLLVRRQRLAALLQAEHDAYTQEIEDSIETDEQRRDRLIRDARRLQREREQRRKDEVAEIQEQQFRESLDDFRTRKSRAIRLQCAQERLTQLETKKRIEAAEAEEAERLHKEYMRTADLRLERELREKEIAKQKNDEVINMISEQVKLKKKFQEQEQEEEEIALQEWRQRLKQQQAEEERKEAAKVARRIKMDAEVAEQNRARLGRYAKIEEEEKALDMKLLQQALEEEERSKQRDAEAKAAAAEENARFQEFLKLQMQKEAQDSSHLDQILARENELAWRKREEKWEREAAAREKLRQQVEGSRQAQLEHREYVGVEEEAAKKAEIARLRRLHEEGLRDDRRKREQRDEELTAYRQQLTQQVAMRENAHKATREEEYQEKMALKAQYEAFDKKVEAVFQSDYKPPANYRRKKVEWYS
eukprot:INCI13616.1.p1 GENE.INCI13616.1~~INCI13616.1.p1  ORF type:complete len:481 (-),score=160.48 INCI13616.1:252-1694(-)